MTKELTYQEALDKLTNIADSLDKKQDELSPEIAEIITALTKVHKDDVVDDNWDNLWDMFENIKSYAKNNGRAIISEDKPKQLRLGFKCTNTNKTWTIKIGNVRKCIETGNLHITDQIERNKACNLLRKCIMTSSGKSALAHMLNSDI